MSFTRDCIRLHAKGDKYNSRKMNEVSLWTDRPFDPYIPVSVLLRGKKSYGDVISQSGLCKWEIKQEYIVNALCVRDIQSLVRPMIRYDGTPCEWGEPGKNRMDVTRKDMCKHMSRYRVYLV